MMGIGALTSRIFCSSNERRLNAYRKKVVPINALEPQMMALSDEELRDHTRKFRAEFSAGRSLDDLLIPAFAVVRESARRVLGQRHFDVQLIGGMVLHDGSIAEMKTGEGKTLVATLAVYLNALSGEGVHVVTVNDYLANRDSSWMGKVYEFLGMSVGVIVHGLSDEERRAAYASDITYCTNNELGFDYLRDNMKYELGQMVQRGHHFAIIDEVDSILIDEARTPLIISGPLEDQSALYTRVDQLIPKLKDVEHFEISEKNKSVVLTEAGNEYLEEILRSEDLLRGENLYDVENVSVVHHVDQALKAHHIFCRDRDYIVKDGSIVLIDEFTGRMMSGRRYSEGLHQALEAKEHVPIQPENQTLASVTFQNYFRMYSKLAGMTGTAATEANEFMEIYNLSLTEIPTNLPIVRVDDEDEVYRTAAEKYEAVINLVEECHARRQPVLVGTTSISKSELLAKMLEERGFKQRDFSHLYDSSSGKQEKLFQVLNARYHEQEAFIIAQAGLPGAVTIATNMAGRGTDIRLGGNPDMRMQREMADVSEDTERSRIAQEIYAECAKLKEEALQAGGLYVIGTERHESRRIDNQLRGRSGRQGDPGHSHFFISLEDDLMRIFGTERMDSVLGKLGLQKGEAIVHPWITKALENAQRKVEARNFDIRKNILKFDDVMNDQRKVIFEQRLALIREETVRDMIVDMREQVIDTFVDKYAPEKVYPEQWEREALDQDVRRLLGITLPLKEWVQEEGMSKELLRTRISQEATSAYAEKMRLVPSTLASRVEKMVLLQMLDFLWREHLAMLDHLRQVIGLRGYGQRDPLNEYRTEAFALFESMLLRLREMVTGQLMHGQFVSGAGEASQSSEPLSMREVHPDHLSGMEVQRLAESKASALLDEAASAFSPEDLSVKESVGRNTPCPCGSGKKFKHCHGKF